MWGVIFSLLVLHGPVAIDEIHGKAVVGTVTAHQRTYLYYGLNPLKGALYILDWKDASFTEVEKDGRVRLHFLGALLPAEQGVVVGNPFTQMLYFLDVDGTFLKSRSVRELCSDGGAIRQFSMNQSDTIWVTVRDGNATLLYALKPEEAAGEQIFHLAGKFEFYGWQDKLIALDNDRHEVRVYDQRFQYLHTFKPLVPIGSDYANLVNPLAVSTDIVFSLYTKVDGHKSMASVTLGEHGFSRPSDQKVLGMWGDKKLIRNFGKDGVLEIVPLD